MLEYWNGAILNNDSFLGSSGGHDLNQMAAINEYETIDDIQSEKLTEEQNNVNSATFAAIGETPTSLRNGISYNTKGDTDLYTMLRKKNFAISIAISPTGTHFAIYGSDRKIRVFDFKRGKLLKQFDDRMKVYDTLVQKQASKNSSNTTMDNIDYGQRAAREREISETSIMGCMTNSFQECGNQSMNIQFDSTGRYLLLPTIIGVKVIEWSSSKCSQVMGKSDSSGLRFLGGIACIGEAKVDRQMQLARSEGSSEAMGDKRQKVSDSMLITLAYNRKRFFIFSHMDPITSLKDHGGKAQQEAILSRDILNEPPDVDDLLLKDMEGTVDQDGGLGTEAILRTTMGDIHISLFPQKTPKTVENFCGHARSGYYDNVIFHRIIKVRSGLLQTSMYEMTIFYYLF